jgi:hypothetical protein
MMRLHLKKQICMEVGCMQNNVIDLMDYIPEIMILIIIVLMFIACIGLGIGKAMKKWEDRNGG